MDFTRLVDMNDKPVTRNSMALAKNIARFSPKNEKVEQEIEKDEDVGSINSLKLDVDLRRELLTRSLMSHYPDQLRD